MNNLLRIKKKQYTFDPHHVWAKGVSVTLCIILVLLGCGGALYYLSLHTDFLGGSESEYTPHTIDSEQLIRVTDELRVRRERVGVPPLLPVTPPHEEEDDTLPQGEEEGELII